MSEALHHALERRAGVAVLRVLLRDRDEARVALGFAALLDEDLRRCHGGAHEARAGGVAFAMRLYVARASSLWPIALLHAGDEEHRLVAVFEALRGLDGLRVERGGLAVAARVVRALAGRHRVEVGVAPRRAAAKGGEGGGEGARERRGSRRGAHTAAPSLSGVSVRASRTAAARACAVQGRLPLREVEVGHDGRGGGRSRR